MCSKHGKGRITHGKPFTLCCTQQTIHGNQRPTANQAGVFAHGHVHWITMGHPREGGQAIVSLSASAKEFG